MAGNLYGSGETSDDMQRTALAERDKEARQQADPSNRLVKQWWREIERYKRASTAWHEEGKQIEDLYLDQDRTQSSTSRRLALLWANVETLKPAVYAKAPTVQCARRFKDRDPVARVAAELIERAANATYDLYGADDTFKAVRDDRLLPGRGQAWVRYEADLEEYEDPDHEATEEQPEAAMLERLSDERVCVDHVHWTDFGHNVASCWADVWLVWRCTYKTAEEVRERFGEDVAARVPYNAKLPSHMSDERSAVDSGAEQFAKILEVWDRRRKQVGWIAEGMKDSALEIGKPPISFANFFPCPQPCYATRTSRSLIPRPDYIYYRDQAKEINDLTDKIQAMTGWLVVKGFVPSAPSRIADAIEEAVRDKGNRELFVSVESWSEFTDRGGINKLIDWLPIDMVIKAIQAAIEARNQLIQDVFQITGISDILRGQTDASETLGAQELKAQTGTRRLRNTKDAIAIFCRDVSRLVCEVIAEKFEPSTIAAMTGYRYEPTPMGADAQPPMAPPPQQPGAAEHTAMTFGDDVIALLRNDRLRSFRVDVETDSTVQADEQAEKASRVEFAETMGSFLERGVNVAGMAPELLPLLGEIITFTTRGFRAGRSMEEEIDRTFTALKEKAQQAAQQPPQPDPNAIKAEMAMKQGEQKMQIEREKHALDMEKMQTEAAIDMQQAETAAQMQQDQHAMKMEQGEAKAQQDADRAAMRPQSGSNGAAQPQPISAPPPSAPQQPSPEIQALAQTMQALAMAMQQSQQQMAVMMQILAAPRAISLQRDETGRPIGAISQTVN